MSITYTKKLIHIKNSNKPTALPILFDRAVFIGESSFSIICRFPTKLPKNTLWDKKQNEIQKRAEQAQGALLSPLFRA